MKCDREKIKHLGKVSISRAVERSDIQLFHISPQRSFIHATLDIT